MTKKITMKSRRTVKLLLRQPELIEIVNKLFDMMINFGNLINYFHSWKHKIKWMSVIFIWVFILETHNKVDGCVILKKVKIGIFDNMYG